MGEKAEKHVAVFVVDSQPGFYLSLVHFLNICNRDKSLNYKYYTETKYLLRDIIHHDNVSGIVAFQFDRKASIENRLRYDLRSFPGFSYYDAMGYKFPPSIDSTIPHQLFEVMKIMKQFQQGEYQEEKFSLRDVLPNLTAQMLVPGKEIKVMIINDDPQEIEGMKVILEAWPNVKLDSFVMETQECMIPIPSIDCLLLIDEDMPIPGERAVKNLLDIGFRGMVISTSKKKPDYAPWHFGFKDLIVSDYESAMEFVSFVNSLLISCIIERK